MQQRYIYIIYTICTFCTIYTIYTIYIICMICIYKIQKANISLVFRYFAAIYLRVLQFCYKTCDLHELLTTIYYCRHYIVRGKLPQFTTTWQKKKILIDGRVRKYRQRVILALQQISGINCIKGISYINKVYQYHLNVQTGIKSGH